MLPFLFFFFSFLQNYCHNLLFLEHLFLLFGELASAGLPNQAISLGWVPSQAEE